MAKDLHFTVHTRKLFILLAIILFILGVWFIRNSAATEPIYSCTQAHAQGIYDITKGSKNYRPSLDRDHDGHACE